MDYPDAAAFLLGRSSFYHPELVGQVERLPLDLQLISVLEHPVFMDHLGLDGAKAFAEELAADDASIDTWQNLLGGPKAHRVYGAPSVDFKSVPPWLWPFVDVPFEELAEFLEPMVKTYLASGMAIASDRSYSLVRNIGAWPAPMLSIETKNSVINTITKRHPVPTQGPVKGIDKPFGESNTLPESLHTHTTPGKASYGITA